MDDSADVGFDYRGYAKSYLQSDIQRLARLNAGEKQSTMQNELLELKALGFSLDEIKMIMDGKTAKAPFLEMLEKKQRT